jgi:hypothetical protein
LEKSFLSHENQIYEGTSSQNGRSGETSGQSGSDDEKSDDSLSDEGSTKLCKKAAMDKISVS